MKNKIIFLGLVFGLMFVSIGNAQANTAGDNNTCFLKSDGTVYCWGYNDHGQLGNDSTDQSLIPVQVKGAGGVGYLTDVIKIAAGSNQTCAVKSDGTLYCWGYNGTGALGDGSLADGFVPTQVKGVGGAGYLTDVVEVAGGYWHTCAAKSDGSVYCWGANNDGQLGNDSLENSSTPVQVKGVGGVGNFSGAIQLTAGGFHTCALKSDGTLYCWGWNGEGELGDNSVDNSSTPVQVKGVGGLGFLSGISQVVMGGSHSCALKSDGAVYCWGANWDGEMGDGTTDERHVPVRVWAPNWQGYLSDVDQIVAEGYHTCVIKTDKSVLCWGANWDGELGDNSTETRYMPVPVVGVDGLGNLSQVEDLALGASHTCVVISDGSIFCWGSNWSGQLGNGSTDGSLTPVQAQGVSGGYLDLGGSTKTFTLNYAADSHGSISGTTHQAITGGENGAEVTAVPNQGYNFAKWSDGSLMNPRTDSSISRNINVTANFGQEGVTHTLTYAAGEGGIISGDSPQTVSDGGDGAVVYAACSEGYHFVSWSDGYTQYSRTDIDVSGDIDVTAIFAPDEGTFATITYTAGVGGSISGANQQTVIFGADGSEVTAVPDPGYRFVSWDDGSTTNPRTDTYVTGDFEVRANFVQNSGDPFYEIDAHGSAVNKFNSSFEITDTFDITIDSGQSVDGASGAAVDPSSNEVYAVLRLQSPGGRYLVKLNMSSGVATVVGNLHSNLSAIAFDNDGQLYGLTGDGDPVNPSSLFTIDKETAGMTFLAAYGNDYRGEALTFNPADNKLYRASGSSIFAIDPNNPNDPETVYDEKSPDFTSVTALMNIDGANFYLTDWNRVYSFDIASQEFTLISILNDETKSMFHWSSSAGEYTLSYAADSNGHISGTANQSINEGEDGEEVNAVPDPGYHFVDWSDGFTQNPRIDSAVSDNIDVTANFAQDVTVTGVTSKYYFASVTPVIENGTATLNGNPFSSGTAITQDGDYTLVATDDYTTPISITFHIITKKTVENPNPDKIGEDLGIGIMETQGGLAETSQATIKIDYTLVNNNASMEFLPGTQIAKVGGGTVNVTALTVQNITNTVQTTVPSSKGAIKIGIVNTPLSFSNHDVTISIPVGSSYDNENLKVYSKPDDSIEWTYETTCLVANGVCSFQTDHATEFTANYEVNNSPDPTHVNVDINATITINCKDQATNTNDFITMNPITGTGQSQLNANNNVNCNIVTNNSSGYTLSFTSSTPELIDQNNDKIDAYTSAVTNAPETWNVSTADSEWGARLQSSSTTYDSTTWGTVGTDDYTAKWYAVTNQNSFILSNRSDETAQTGDDQVIRFGAEVGASKFQPSGTYIDGVTFTAVTN